jgi:hypothetical protein
MTRLTERFRLRRVAQSEWGQLVYPAALSFLIVSAAEGAQELAPDALLRFVMSRCLLNIAKRSLLRLMLSCVGLASKHAAG